MPTWLDFVNGWELFRDPVLAAVGAGAALGLLGVFVILRRMVFLAAGLAQAAGLGVAVAFFAQIHLGLGVDPYLGSLVITGLTAALLYRKPRGRLTREGLLGLAYLVAAGLALMLGTRISQEAHDIQAILFGTGVMVRPEDTQLVLAGATLVLGLSLWWRRGIVFASFDPEGARVRGLPVRRLNLALMLAIALMVSISTRSLGALPVFAFSVLPALGAIALAPSPTVALLVAALFGAVAGGGGYLLAFFGQFPVGASQTVVAGALALGTIAVGALRRR